jgi:hypothetical protein
MSERELHWSTRWYARLPALEGSAHRKLFEAIDRALDADEALVVAVNEVCPSRTKGWASSYAGEPWRVIHAREEETEIILGLDPPEHEYRWLSVTAEILEELRAKFLCDFVRAHSITDYLGRAKIRYFAVWKKEKKADDANAR